MKIWNYLFFFLSPFHWTMCWTTIAFNSPNNLKYFTTRFIMAPISSCIKLSGVNKRNPIFSERYIFRVLAIVLLENFKASVSQQGSKMSPAYLQSDSKQGLIEDHWSRKKSLWFEEIRGWLSVYKTIHKFIDRTGRGKKSRSNFNP